MAKPAKSKGINPDVEEAISQLLRTTMADKNATLIDKMRVIDRALNLEKIKAKLSDDDWGAAFLSDDKED